MCIDRLLFVIRFRPVSEHENNINLLLSSLRDKKLQAWTKYSLSPPKNKKSRGAGIFPSSKASFMSLKLYSSFISSIVFFLYDLIINIIIF